MKTQEVRITKNSNQNLEVFQRDLAQRKAYEFEIMLLDLLGNQNKRGAFVWAEDDDYNNGLGYKMNTLPALSVWGVILEADRI